MPLAWMSFNKMPVFTGLSSEATIRIELMYTALQAVA